MGIIAALNDQTTQLQEAVAEHFVGAGGSPRPASGGEFGDDTKQCYQVWANDELLRA